MDIDIDFIDSRKASTVTDVRLPSRKVSKQEPASFEEAITATQFGRYNIMLAFLAMLSSFCTVFDTSTMSYTFVAAHCDLELTLSDKGLLNAVTYAGMISSAVIWGFLFDVLGRRKLLIIGFILDAIFVFMSVLTQGLTLLLVSKYLQGLIINGPFAAVSAYISEFHCAKYRPIYQMLIGTSNSFSSIVLPVLAWMIMPQNLDFQLMNMNFHSWNIFLLISGLPAFLSGICFVFFPESPKFLMTCGENEKALKVFQKVYSINTGHPPETYPIKYLANETKFVKNGNGYEGTIGKQSKRQALKGGFSQLKPIFLKPHVMKLLLTSSIFLFLTMAVNMLRLWLPQIFQMMTDYQVDHDGASAPLCTMLDTSVSSPGNRTAEECFVNIGNSGIYINSIIVGATAMCGNIVAAALIRFIGKKKILLVALIFSTIFAVSMYFASTPEVAIASSSIFIAGGSVSNNVMISVAVDLFPTTLRTMAISVGMMIGRSGAMIGNFIFPYLLESGCEAPFFVVASYIFVATLLTLMIPNTDMKPLT
ncbi:synaptic vesicle glycoprotein 2B-like [Euwallacea fornicatus]|uniref:synaptic vesicle glycoprotein 2B-like n=1 Tax=Euwallacea fornicatus TaxID=995702 RepID=UPI00338F28CD